MFNYNEFDLPEKIGILLTTGFEEGTAVFCTDMLRNAGLPVSVIGTSNQLIRGKHGIKIEPDQAIGDIDPNQKFRLIIISGGRQYITSSMTDPRIYNLLQQTIQTNGYIAPIARAKEFLEDAGCFFTDDTSYIVSNNDKALKDFVDELIQLASIEFLQPDIVQ